MLAHIIIRRQNENNTRLCDGKPVKLPLPHFKSDYERCLKCEDEMDKISDGRRVLPESVVDLGLGLSFAK